MTQLLQWTQLIYNISFIIFTLVLVIYAIKEYNNNKKQPYRLISRINYCFTNDIDNVNTVNLDIFNYGDYAAQMVQIRLIINHNPPFDLDRISFIAPKENFQFYLGKRVEKTLILFNGQSFNLADPMDYDYFTEETINNTVTLTIHTI